LNQTILRPDLDISDELDASDIPPLLKRVYANRKITDPNELNYRFDQLLDFHSLKGIEDAVGVMADALSEKKNIIVIGDYDADGATSTALMVRALRMFGHDEIAYLVPNRFEYGYGLTPQIVDVALELKPELIITVDNGISSVDGVSHARKHGVKVVITDHHLAGKVLPEADAIVNPNQPGCEFPSKCIAGVGVAFYTMLALRAKLRDNGWFGSDEKVPNMACLLDIVALGTVADVVALDKNNRIMVEHGLERIRKGQCCPGLLALLQVSGRDYSGCTSMDLAFYVAPRLNAAGRLENMSQGIECLLSDDEGLLRDMAAQLHSLNAKRRDIEKDMLAMAYRIMDSEFEFSEDEALPAGLCIYNAAWHQGVIGLLASRVKEKYYRPVIAFADADADSDEIKGSARSIPGLHIRDVLEAIATSNPGLIQKFGGHAMAAGLSLDKSRFDLFSAKYLEEVERKLAESDLEKVILSDGAISSDEMNLESAEILRLAGPWGQNFQEPMFDDVFEVLNWKVVGANHLKMQLKMDGADDDMYPDNASGPIVEAIAFNKDESVLPAETALIRASYRMSVNEFRNKRTLQLIVDCIEPA